MRKIALALLLCIISVTYCNAISYYSINYDKNTVAKMTAGYAAEVASESYYTQQTEKILEHYESAELAAAGIFASKFLDRKALTDISGWSSSTENYYYHRIYNMVSSKIIPKMWDCAAIMIKDPSSSVYWGSYLLKTTEEVKSLCHQFESIVTNGSLSFGDIVFPELNTDIKNLVRLSEIGGVKWEDVFNTMTKEDRTLTISDIETDVKTLYSMGLGLASGGWQGAVDRLLESSQFHGTIVDKINKVRNVAESYSDMFEHYGGDIGTMMMNIVGNNVDKLFVEGSYGNSEWQSDYANGKANEYYTQRWYIYSVDQGEEILCSYTPSVDNSSILNGGEWYRINTNDMNFYPTLEQGEEILRNSEGCAGWSRAKVNELNAVNDGYTYTFSKWLNTYYIYKGDKSNVVSKAYAYDITVTKRWYRKIEVYEETFDSYDMDLATFNNILQVKLDELNRNEDGTRYYLGSDSKRYYEKSEAQKLKGSETATIYISCNGGANLGEGTTQYKCSDCGSSLNDHTKSCVMKTSLTEDNLNTSDIDANIEDTRNSISILQKEQEELKEQQKQLAEQLRYSSTESPAIREQLNEVTAEIKEKDAKIKSQESRLQELQDARQELIDSEGNQTDDWYRIPAIMNDLKSAYGFTWNDDGHWDGYTYVRTACMAGINGKLTFNAIVSMARKPKYILGIKVSRAIVQISWKLTTSYSDKEIVEVIPLDSGKSDEEKANEVNERIKSVKNDYPDCDVSVTYSKVEGKDNIENVADTYHLLWASDRLSIAREIDMRLNKIYASLVCYEKMMHYKYGIVDWLSNIVPYINDEDGRRYDLAQRCHQRWLYNAVSINTRH